MAFSVRAGCGGHCGKSLVCYGEKTKQSQRPDLKRQQAKGWGGSGEPLQAVCKATRGKAAAAVHTGAWQGKCGVVGFVTLFIATCSLY